MLHPLTSAHSCRLPRCNDCVGYLDYFCVSTAAAYPIAVGTVITDRPPHRSVRAQLRHTAPTLGGDGEADARPWVKNLGLWEKVIGQLCDPLPCEVILLTAAPQRAQPEAHNMVAKGAECREVSRHGVIGKVAPNDLRQPTPLFGDRLVHSPP